MQILCALWICEDSPLEHNNSDTSSVFFLSSDIGHMANDVISSTIGADDEDDEEVVLGTGRIAFNHLEPCQLRYQAIRNGGAEAIWTKSRNCGIHSDNRIAVQECESCPCSSL